MSSSQLLKNNCGICLFKAYNYNSDNTLISGWLSEMDGENIEEDREIHSYHLKLDGPISCLSLKKVFETSPCPVSIKQ